MHMKTLLTTALIMSVVFLGQSQDISNDSQPRDEFKINALNLIAFTYMDLSYERLLHEEASLGVSVLINIGNDNELLGLGDYHR